MAKIIKVEKAIRFMNVGEDPPNPAQNFIGMRQWEACRNFNFMSAGQGKVFSEPLSKIEVNDIIAAYISGRGYAGIGNVVEKSIPIKNFKFNDKVFNEFKIESEYINDINHNIAVVEGLNPIRKSLFRNCLNEKSEYVIRIDWIETVPVYDAYWQKKAGLFAKPMVTCNLSKQLKTIAFLERSFDVKFV